MKPSGITKNWLKSTVPTEYEEQKNVARWLDSRDVLWTATANGGSLKGGAMGWAKLRASGVKPGVPDILVFEQRHGFVGIAIELKRRGWRFNREEHVMKQAAYLKGMEKRGWFVMFACGAEEAISVLEWYLRA